MRTHNTVSPQITRAAGTLDDARDELRGADILLRDGVIAGIGSGLETSGEVVEAADRHGRVVSFAEKTERKYFPERFPFEPFGSAFEDHPEREERRKRRRPTSPPPAAPYRLHQEDVHPHSAPHSEKQEL